MKIVGLSSVTNPYIQARWSAVALNCKTYDLHHIEFGRVSKTYDWQPVEIDVPYERVVLSDEPSQFQSFRQLSTLVRRLLKSLKEINPEVVILNGYQQPATLAALFWSKLCGKKIVLLSESKEDDAPRKVSSEGFKRFLLKNYHAALVGGEKHRAYLVKLGMDPRSIYLGHNIIGNDDYHPNKLAHLPAPSETQRPYFLAINRFITKKNIPTILNAYSDYRHRTLAEPWDLILCGDGELRPQIEAQVQTLGLASSVRLPGFLQPHELLPYFAHASCFVHASTQEQWGLVVNEAMAAGLPVLVSRCCGCFDELVIEGVNGFGFEAEQASELTSLMLKMSDANLNLSKMKQAALAHIEKCGPQYFSTGLDQAIQYALDTEEN